MSDITSVSNLATQYINEALKPSTAETSKTNNKEAFSDLL